MSSHRSGVPSPPQTGAAVRAWDRRAVEEFGIPAVVLMENAGSGAARLLRRLTEESPQVYREPFRIFCGPGNNGGDGFVVARYLLNYGYDVRLFVCGEPRYAAGSESAVHFNVTERMGLRRENLLAAEGDERLGQRVEFGGGTNVDALFGTGLSRALEAPFAELVDALNASERPTVALDVPSGLDADTGKVHGTAIEARETITFAAAKLGLTLADGPRLSGRVHVLDIGLPRELWEDR